MPDRTERLTAEINVTPFLDVLLVLIITFMASVTARRALDVQLPTPCGPSCTGNAPMMITLRADGTFLLDGQAVAHDALDRTLRSAYLQRPGRGVAIAAFPGVTYQSVVSAMDVARSAGASSIAIAPRSTLR